VFWSY